MKLHQHQCHQSCKLLIVCGFTGLQVCECINLCSAVLLNFHFSQIMVVFTYSKLSGILLAVVLINIIIYRCLLEQVLGDYSRLIPKHQALPTPKFGVTSINCLPRVFTSSIFEVCSMLLYNDIVGKKDY